MKLFEERKANRNGFEIPIECLTQTINHSNFSEMAHYHDYVEILYGTDCDAFVWCGGKEYNLKTGDLVIVNSRIPHGVRSSVNRASSYIVIKFLPQILYAAEQSVFEFKYVLPFVADTDTFKNVFTKEELESSEIPDILFELMREWNDQSYGYEIALRILVSRFVLCLIRSWYTAENFLESYETMGIIQRAVEYAQKNFQYATLNDVASECGLSYSYFSRLFKRVMGRSFTQHVNRIRITEAQRLLASSEKSITEIAQDVGFSTASYFIDIFKEQTNVTPMQFRTNCRK
jgi:AraC-like DNA-binding protein